ncbi:MAG TPA: SHOCT domain-containing protein [Jiangellaceae bacterium]
MGLLRGVARTAVVAGTATAVSNRVSRRQATRWQQQEYEQQAPPQQYAEPAAPAAPAAPSDPTVAELERLAGLRSQGLITDEEFAAAKAKLLGL